MSAGAQTASAPARLPLAWPPPAGPVQRLKDTDCAVAEARENPSAPFPGRSWGGCGGGARARSQEPPHGHSTLSRAPRGLPHHRVPSQLCLRCPAPCSSGLFSALLAHARCGGSRPPPGSPPGPLALGGCSRRAERGWASVRSSCRRPALFRRRRAQGALAGVGAWGSPSSASLDVPSQEMIRGGGGVAWFPGGLLLGGTFGPAPTLLTGRVWFQFPLIFVLPFLFFREVLGQRIC